MAVRIVVIAGPDQGRMLDITNLAEVRIGRGPGNHLVISEPAWEGQLRVLSDGGVYLVRNQLSTSAYLGQTVIGTNQELTWYTNEIFYATRATHLRLTVDQQVTLEEEPKKKDTNSNWLLIGIIILAVPVVAFSFLADLGESKNSAANNVIPYEELTKKLELSTDRTTKGILDDLRAAKLAESAQKPREAYDRYLDLRDVLERKNISDDKSQEIKNVYKETKEFVTARLLELSRKLPKKRR